MAKVTGKFQITLPKAAVDECGIKVGDTLEVRVRAGDLHIVRPAATGADDIRRERLAHFDRATRRQRDRAASPRGRTRGWTREELYARGRTR